MQRFRAQRIADCRRVRLRRTLLQMLLNPAVGADYAAIVDLANLAFRGSGSVASWNIETGIIEGQRLNESLLREDLAAKPDAQLLTYRGDRDGALLGTVWLDEEESIRKRFPITE